MNNVIPWSWSMLEAYQTCPRAFYETKIAKNFRYPDSEELRWGNMVHNALKERIADSVPLPNNMGSYEWIAVKLEAAPGDKYCELATAVNYDLKPCGFWDKDCWNRGYEDIAIINGTKAVSIDYKTGKFKPRSRQLDLSALRIFALFPEVQTVQTAFAYLQTKQWVRDVFHREQYTQLWETFYPDITDMLWSMEHNVWPMKPSGLCKRSRKPGSTYAGCPVATCPNSEFYRK